MNIQNNLESQSNATQIGAKIPDNSKAFGLINKQDCRSDLLRSLLDDFVTVNGPVANYAMIPEKDRLKKFFNVAPPRKEIRQTILAGISRLEENKRLLAYLIEYVAFWVEYYRIFLPDPSFTCFISQFIIPSAKRLNQLPRCKHSSTVLGLLRRPLTALTFWSCSARPKAGYEGIVVSLSTYNQICLIAPLARCLEIISYTHSLGFLHNWLSLLHSHVHSPSPHNNPLSKNFLPIIVSSLLDSVQILLSP